MKFRITFIIIIYEKEVYDYLIRKRRKFVIIFLVMNKKKACISLL